MISELFLYKLNFEDRGLFCYYILRITTSDTSPSNGTLASAQQIFFGLFRHICVCVCACVRYVVDLKLQCARERVQRDFDNIIIITIKIPLPSALSFSYFI
jgi:hypothetical protein